MMEAASPNCPQARAAVALMSLTEGVIGPGEAVLNRYLTTGGNGAGVWQADDV